jgi:hypothetical protein
MTYLSTITPYNTVERQKKLQRKKTKHTMLNNIYKSSQCTDVSDCEIAIQQVKELANLYGWNGLLQRRYASLEKRKKQLENG